ncbi:MAG: GNAT family N-acetyltransferase [Clostridia bacterium]|nr:GNAT family N-acetyltransferase [Clostridia bacterium]
MAQLKMYWLKGTPIADLELPEGYSISNYKDASDKMPWVECCKNGLEADDADESRFDSRITDHDDINMETDVFFLDYEGEHIGTATAVFHPEDNCGELHMVGIRTEFRGKGLGKYLNNVCVKKLAAQNVDYIYLTTDEWRMGAVKSYLTAGFVPVEYDKGMKQRWEWMLAELEVDGEFDMVNEDCSFFAKIKKSPTIRVGVLGVGRGRSMIEYCRSVKGAKTVAICDNYIPMLELAKKDYEGEGVTFYDNYEDFLTHDMDVVVLANYATEHAPFAVKALDKGFNVISEVLPVQTMKEAVELVEAVERSGKMYFFAENCCYMPAPKKMKELYEAGALGKFEYGEGEYMHNLEADWHMHTQGRPDHWRTLMHAFYYCTHSIGPLIHITGLRPVKVSGFEVAYNDRMYRMGAKAAPIGLEIITLENGALLKSVHGIGCAGHSIWYSVNGSKGRMETAREDAENEDVQTLYVNCDENEGDNNSKPRIVPTWDHLSDFAEKTGHGGADYYFMHNVIEALRGNEADTIDVYEGLDMFLPGMFAYFSALEGGIPMDIPNLRNPEERDKWRNDTRCTDPKVAGDMFIPGYSKGNPDIPEETYLKLQAKFREEMAKKQEN